MLTITATTAAVWTAIGTLALAVATFVSLFFARSALKKTQDQIELGQHQLAQTQCEIELSRREVEEAHRPVIVPVIDMTSYMDLGADGAGLPRCPVLREDGLLFVPVENIGAGPALNVEASISGSSLPAEGAPDPQTPARLAGLGEGRFVALCIELPRWKELWTFTLTVEYSDVAGKAWRTQCVYFREMDRYDGVTITERLG